MVSVDVVTSFAPDIIDWKGCVFDTAGDPESPTSPTDLVFLLQIFPFWAVLTPPLEWRADQADSKPRR